AVAERGAAATRGAFIAALVPRDGRVRFRAVLRSLTNAAGALGAAAGSFVLVWDTAEAYRGAAVINSLTFAVAALFVATAGVRASRRAATSEARHGGGPPADASLRDAAAPPTAASTPVPGPSAIAVGTLIPPTTPAPPKRLRFDTAARDRPFLVITGLNAVLLLHTTMITTALPLWVAERTDAPLWVVSAAIVLNAVGVVLLQVPASRRVRDVSTAARAGRLAAVLLAVAAVALGASGLVSGAATVALILLAACAHLGGELFQACAAWELAFDLAPETAQGQYHGVFNAGQDLGGMISPLLFTAIVATLGAGGWVAVAALFVGAGLALVPATRWAARSREMVA
ncbi:hypothetical protein N869_11575, partial [Cellulomonas bogoriensis 69B4 = DSM 16987]